MTGIAVAVMPDAGAPQVGVTIDGLDGASTSVITVDVSWDGGASWSGVRGATNLTVTGSTFIRDHVPALNVESTYRLTVVSGVTTPPTLTATITPASDTAWLQDPLDPRSAVPIIGANDPSAILVLSPSAGKFLRTQPMDLVTVEGSDLPVASVGMRRAPSGLPMILHAVPAEQGALINQLRGLFARAGQVVMRGLPSGVPISPVAHVVPGDVVEVPGAGSGLGVRNEWEFTVTQTRPTSLRIVVPWWTYDQVKALWAAYTYTTAIAARPGDTYLDWLISPEVP